MQEADDYDDDDMSMPDVPQLVQPPKRRRIEEEEDELEPMIPGPPPKFVTVKTASPSVPEIRDNTVQTHASTSNNAPTEEAQLALDHLQPEQGLIPTLEFNDIQDKQSTVQALEMQLEDALKTEDQMIGGTGVVKAELMEKEIKNIETLVQIPPVPLRTPLAAPISAASPAAAAPRAAGQPSGWIKKASSMLAPPLLSTHTTTSSFLPKKVWITYKIVINIFELKLQYCIDLHNIDLLCL